MIERFRRNVFRTTQTFHSIWQTLGFQTQGPGVPVPHWSQNFCFGWAAAWQPTKCELNSFRVSGSNDLSVGLFDNRTEFIKVNLLVSNDLKQPHFIYQLFQCTGRQLIMSIQLSV